VKECETAVAQSASYGMNDAVMCSIICINKSFSSAKYQDRLWGPPSFPFKGCWGLLSLGQSGAGHGAL